MKVLNRPIKIISITDENGEIQPVRFQISDKASKPVTIKIEKILNIHEEKVAGTVLRMFHCQSTIKGQLKDYELRYNTQTCKWYLFKM